MGDTPAPVSLQESERPREKYFVHKKANEDDDGRWRMREHGDKKKKKPPHNSLGRKHIQTFHWATELLDVMGYQWPVLTIHWRQLLEEKKGPDMSSQSPPVSLFFPWVTFAWTLVPARERPISHSQCHFRWVGGISWKKNMRERKKDIFRMRNDPINTHFPRNGDWKIKQSPVSLTTLCDNHRG